MKPGRSFSPWSVGLAPVCVSLWFAFHGAATLVAAQVDGQPLAFESQVRPVLQAHCVKCHGEKSVKGGLDLRRGETLLQGGDSGPAVVPGNKDESLLIQKIESGEMPPPKEGRLEKKQQELIRRWVTEGARLTDVTSPGPRRSGEETAHRVSDDDRRFWAFQPPARPEAPRVTGADLVRTPIDAFLLARLEARKLTFSQEATREVLLRRLCFDLLGLPPTPEQRDDFLTDRRNDAYERLVDRLLASPAYGERWGRHWLDLAGYADSDGSLAADRVRPQAWRYRDYVIKAFNDDMPFDQFLTEQLAGDELSDWRGADSLSTAMIRQLAATGFLRTASDPTYPGYTEPNEIHQVLSDTMQIVGSTFLGITLQCARCHAHKFDPIPQRDYYAFQSIFLPALDPARWQPSEVRGIPLATDKELTRLRAENEIIDKRIKSIQADLKALTERQRRQRIDALVSGQPKAIQTLARAALEQPVEKRSAEQKALVQRLGPMADTALDEAGLAAQNPEYKKQAERLNAAITAETGRKKPDPVLVRGLSDLPGKTPEGRLMVRGDHTRPGATVTPAVPEVLAAPGFQLQLASSVRSSGRRLALARWLTAPDHPLTARVQVNRIWAHHFGRGLVATTANLGHSGAKPSHPELLDWLATEFIRSGWSTKSIHRLMVTSTAYRQSSQADTRTLAADPDNILLGRWRPRRMEGEVLRDSILAVSGDLNGKRFGPPVPVTAKDDGAVETPDDAEGKRRSIYMIVRRSQHITMLELFDTPSMEINCPERFVSTVPLQALAMLHDPFVERHAVSLAARIRDHARDDQHARMVYAYRLLFAREPTSSEESRIRRVPGRAHPRRGDGHKYGRRGHSCRRGTSRLGSDRARTLEQH